MRRIQISGCVASCARHACDALSHPEGAWTTPDSIGNWPLAVARHYAGMALSSTQIGAIGENLLINAVMKASDGRLTPFQPLADDDGLDVLFFDKETGNSVAIQLKCRTTTIRKRGSDERGNVAHFQVRQATFSDARRAYLVAALCNKDLTGFIATWFVPMELLPELAKDISGNWVLRPSKAEASLDRYTPYRCMTAEALAQRIIAICER